MKTWHAPVVVVVIVLIASAGFVFFGPQIGLPLGAAIVALLIIYAIRQKPVEPILPPTPPDTAAHILVVIGRALEDSTVTEQVAEAIEAAEPPASEWPDRTEVLLLAPAHASLLDRWASDVSRSRSEAQRRLVVSVASLAKAEVGAEARVGDADLLQAIEDQLHSFPATHLVLVTGPPETDHRGERAAAELRGRLSIPLSRIVDHGSS